MTEANVEEAIFLIPARSGSKGIKDKNIQQISGKSLLEIAVSTAQKSALPFPIVVSSDSQDYLNTIGPDVVRHQRRKSAAADTSSAEDVIIDFVNQSSLNIGDETSIIYLQPTSPFRTSKTIEKAWKLHKSVEAPVCSVYKSEPLKVGKFFHELPNNKIGAPLGTERTNNRQAMRRYLYPNGAIYVFNLKHFNDNFLFPIEGSTFLEMNRLESWDIDEVEDLYIAQKIGLKNV
jgi:CMP-N-acetylneuraminic acid synthetase